MESLVESGMRSFAEWTLTQPGIRHIHQLKDPRTGELVGISFWDRREDCESALALSESAPEAAEKNRALASALQRPLETSGYEILWEGRKA